MSSGLKNEPKKHCSNNRGVRRQGDFRKVQKEFVRRKSAQRVMLGPVGRRLYKRVVNEIQ